MRELDDITGAIVDESLRIHGGSRVIVELKSVERLAPVHSKQLLTSLKLTRTPVGLLITFGAATLREGLHRIVNGLPASPRLRLNQSPDLVAMRRAAQRQDDTQTKPPAR